MSNGSSWETGDNHNDFITRLLNHFRKEIKKMKDESVKEHKKTRQTGITRNSGFQPLRRDRKGAAHVSLKTAGGVG